MAWSWGLCVFGARQFRGQRAAAFDWRGIGEKAGSCAQRVALSANMRVKYSTFRKYVAYAVIPAIVSLALADRVMIVDILSI